ncbi:MAG: tRNA lysidine(34) synthetase TilS [Bacteroidales bacterium]|nr:tRNA lysidine(34) synthetase TilS [Bacteroidales bacterium]
MIEKFKSFIEKFDLCEKGEQIMLAVSGGIDSVAMTDLFYEAGYSFTILHCNFNLRGAESDADEAFVRSLASRYDVPIFVKQFDTHEYARERGISIQMAARELRYNWFNEIADKMDADSVSTAHNMNDSVETALINLTRGSGIKGITGIPVINDKFIRPLLFATRNEIAAYCKNRFLDYREDSSNSSKKYHRNKIRHDIIPLFEKINPSFVQTMHENLNRFRESHEIYREYVVKKRNELFIEKEEHTEVNLESLKQLQPRSSWLYELFNDYGFTMDQCLNIEKLLNASSGKQFISPYYRLFRDREKLLLYKTESSTFERYYIDSPESKVSLPFSLDIEVLKRDELEEIPDSQNIACLDLELLNFPLIIRKWQHGDYFFPLGMEKMKKVSDFFIDNKVPVPVKERTWILTSGRNIVWITGQRIDNRFKVSESTGTILKLHLYN